MHSNPRIRTALVGAVLAIGAIGCERPAATAPKPAPAPLASTTTGAVDWAKVETGDPGQAIMAYKTLARYCDAWHRGAVETITLTFVPLLSVKDDRGHEVELTPVFMNESVWKGIVTLVRRGTPDGSPLQAAASKSEFYQGDSPAFPKDTFGVIPRYRYRIEVVDDGAIRFVNVGKLDDGV